jgi:hypothetical protein
MCSSFNYVKRKNTELFKKIKEELNVENAQNYNPIMDLYFSMTEKNYNSINFTNKYFIKNVAKPQLLNEDLLGKHESNLFNCVIEDDKGKTEKNMLFVKFAPLLDPIKFLIGKYNINDFNNLTLPLLTTTESKEMSNKLQNKICNRNNSSYVDGFFSYISSQLGDKYAFTHSVKYYGGFIGIKNDFKYNVIDDLSYLDDSKFFNDNKNVAFDIDNYDYLIKSQNKIKQNPINIGNEIDLEIPIFNIFTDLETDIIPEPTLNIQDTEELELVYKKEFELTDNDAVNNEELQEETKENTFTYVNLNSKSSSISSNSSHTTEDDDDENILFIDGANDEDANIEENTDEEGEEGEEEGEDDENSEEDDDEYDDNEIINATIKNMPVNIIFLENCYSTFDELINSEELNENEWLSAFLQIIMNLLAYQKAFSFVHNDLHTNNIMYNKTEKRFIVYLYNGIYYKIPTFGRIYKIIDFGRAIYKYNGQLFFSDSLFIYLREQIIF